MLLYLVRLNVTFISQPNTTPQSCWRVIIVLVIYLAAWIICVFWFLSVECPWCLLYKDCLWICWTAINKLLECVNYCSLSCFLWLCFDVFCVDNVLCIPTIELEWEGTWHKNAGNSCVRKSTTKSNCKWLGSERLCMLHVLLSYSDLGEPLGSQ